jgi:hypothetical protein
VITEDFKPWTSYQPDAAIKKKITIDTAKFFNYIYLYNKNTGKQVTLKLVPDTVSESYKARLISESPFGTIRPYYFYTGGEAKTIAFSFDIHEDLNSINNSVYTIVDRIKSMSNPVLNNGTIAGPAVYMQLGNQFAGTGHIVTAFEYKKPYDINTGRYKLISCSLTFTYHETFENIPVDLGNLEYEWSIPSLNVPGKLADTVLSLYNENDLVASKNFLQLNLDYDYMINYVFSDEKIRKVFNIVGSAYSLGEKSSNTDLKELQSSFESSTIIDMSKFSYSKGLNVSVNTWAVELYNMYMEYLEIMSPASRFKQGNALNNLKARLLLFVKGFKHSWAMFSRTPSNNIVIGNNYVLGDPSNSWNYGGQSVTYIKPIANIKSYYDDFIAANNAYIGALAVHGSGSQITIDAYGFAIAKYNQLDSAILIVYSSNFSGWYETLVAYYYTDGIDLEAIEAACNKLYNIVDMQLRVLTALYGAGE